MRYELNKFKLFFGTFAIAIFFVVGSCKKDKISYSVTPYKLDVPGHFPQMAIPQDNPMTVEGVALGRKLFYETKLSRDNSISCASCHKQENGFSDPNKFSIGVDDQVGTRQSMALVNMGWQQSFFWDGRVKTLEEQIFHPVRDPIEMDLNWGEAVTRLKNDVNYSNEFYRAFNVENFDSTHVSKAIAQFLRTMISGKSKYDVMYKIYNDLPLTAYDQNLEPQITTEEWAGYELFFSLTGGDCLHCHDGPLAQVHVFSNNGIDTDFKDLGRYLASGNPNDMGKFKVPTLRNIELTAPYMHDGRFQTLEEVVMHYSFGVQAESPNLDPMMEFAHQGGVNLDVQERELLLAFLKTFTDWDFVNNPDFSDPFE